MTFLRDRYTHNGGLALSILGGAQELDVPSILKLRRFEFRKRVINGTCDRSTIPPDHILSGRKIGMVRTFACNTTRLEIYEPKAARKFTSFKRRANLQVNDTLNDNLTLTSLCELYNVYSCEDKAFEKFLIISALHPNFLIWFSN